jgi:hypothetical protein
MSPLSILIVIVVIVFVIMLLRYIFVDPYTLQEIKNGKDASTISASSLATNGDAPSSNFAYSIWFYINDWNYRYGEPKVIYGRMGQASTDGTGSISGINGVGPCPAVVLGPVENNVSVSLACFPGSENAEGGDSVIHTCMVSNIPIQKWVNLVVSVYGRSMDLYIDGKLVRTCLLPGTAKVNNNADVYVTPKGGFDGWTARLQYYPNSLNPQEVWNIYTKGYSNALSIFGAYSVEVSLMENGSEKSSVTIG